MAKDEATKFLTEEQARESYDAICQSNSNARMSEWTKELLREATEAATSSSLTFTNEGQPSQRTRKEERGCHKQVTLLPCVPEHQELS